MLVALGGPVAGLVLNATVGWWWADPLAALVIAGLAADGGLEAVRPDHDDPQPVKNGRGVR